MERNNVQERLNGVEGRGEGRELEVTNADREDSILKEREGKVEVV